MPTEFELDPPEGPYHLRPKRFRRFDDHEIKISDLGGLLRDSFDYIGDWSLMMFPEKYGVAYRIAVKERFEDDEGDLATLFFHFHTPIKYRGIQNFNLEEYNRRVQRVIELSAMEASQRFDNIIVIALHPEDWMMQELLQQLSGN